MWLTCSCDLQQGVASLPAAVREADVAAAVKRVSAESLCWWGVGEGVSQSVGVGLGLL